jgi:hypothetical protein
MSLCPSEHWQDPGNYQRDAESELQYNKAPGEANRGDS